jgi:DNA polymerase-1
MSLDPAKFGSAITKVGTFTVDDAVLKNIDNKACQYILKLRELSKQKSTYFENLKGLVTPFKFVHPNLSMVSTKTGRLSCNKPNIQNQTTIGGIKNSYISRWPNGVLVEMDFSQLEMVGLAIVSDDKQLQEDISEGVDTHTELYKKMYGVAPSAAERKAFKPLTFGLVYGAGAKTLSEQGACSVADAKKFIEVFYDRYKGVKLWHDSMGVLAEKNKALTTKHTAKGMPMHAYLHRMPTGRMYVFSTYDNEWKSSPSFSPTELKNWPIQGFSTGDIVPHMVGEITEYIYSKGYGNCIKPIMTVHDSILFDCASEKYLYIAENIRKLLNYTSSTIEHHFKINMPIALNVGMSVGKTWGDMENVPASS